MPTLLKKPHIMLCITLSDASLVLTQIQILSEHIRLVHICSERISDLEVHFERKLPGPVRL